MLKIKEKQWSCAYPTFFEKPTEELFFLFLIFSFILLFYYFIIFFYYYYYYYYYYGCYYYYYYFHIIQRERKNNGLYLVFSIFVDIYFGFSHWTISYSGFELAIRGSTLPFRGSFWAIFCEIRESKLPFYQNFRLQVNYEVSVYTSSSTIRLYFTPKSGKLCAIFLNLDSILVKIFRKFSSKPPMEELAALPHTP